MNMWMNYWTDLLPADGQWHEVWLRVPFWAGNNSIWPGSEEVRTRLRFWTEDGSGVLVDMDNLTNDCMWCQSFLGDSDGDNVPNTVDNAPQVYNPDQLDSDNDGVGDVADAYPLDPVMSEPDPLIPPTDGSSNIGTAGGTFSTMDNTMDIQIPQGTVTTDTTITIAQPVLNPGNLIVETDNGGGELIAEYVLIPDGIQFNGQVTLVFHYDEQYENTNLGVYLYNPSSGIYELIPSVRDSVLNTLTIDVSHFSTYAVIQLSDSTPPAIGITLQPVPNSAGWNNTIVTASFACSDADSGIAVCPVPVTVSDEGEGQVITGTAVDIAGNSAVASISINIDKTPPIINCPIDTEILAMELTGAPVYASGIQTFLTGATAIDINHVISISNNAPDFFPIGQTTLTFTATDIAGNQSICTASVTVVNPPPVLDIISDQIVQEGQMLVFNISASDPNDPSGSGLTYWADGLPLNGTIDPLTGIFHYTPSYDVSTYQFNSFFDVIFYVSDGTSTVSMPVHITVNNVNRPPVANAGIDLHLECAGASCPVVLDGAGSTDPDSLHGTQDDIVQYRWFEGERLLGTGITIVTDLIMGVHDITLKVIDLAGAEGTDTIRVTLDPAHLSMFMIEKAEVDWPKTSGQMAEVKLHGKLALPVGLLLGEVSPVGRTGLDLAGQSGILDQTVNFTAKGSDGEKWEYKANPTGTGIQDFFIHWKGTKFNYSGLVHLETEFIAISQTALSLKLGSITEPVTLQIKDIIVSIDSSGNVTTSVPYEIDEDGEITLTLPFELTPDQTIILTIGIQPPLNIHVGDYYTPASGKFEIKAKVNPGSLTGASRPAELGMNLALGTEGFPGSVVVSGTDWDKLSVKEWKAELEK
ncbi:MAG: HYR domain-containing protein [Nitrospirae bacterium]|nr:HYR domain-containing protein [Nitrospirota bacterium]